MPASCESFVVRNPPVVRSPELFSVMPGLRDYGLSLGSPVVQNRSPEAFPDYRPDYGLSLGSPQFPLQGEAVLRTTAPLTGEAAPKELAA